MRRYIIETSPRAEDFGPSADFHAQSVEVPEVSASGMTPEKALANLLEIEGNAEALVTSEIARTLLAEILRDKGQKIQVIKWVRAITGWSLKSAKGFVDAVLYAEEDTSPE